MEESACVVCIGAARQYVCNTIPLPSANANRRHAARCAVGAHHYLQPGNRAGSTTAANRHCSLFYHWDAVDAIRALVPPRGGVDNA